MALFKRLLCDSLYVIFLSSSLIKTTTGGFTQGAPCSQKNTAYINPGKTQYPLAQVKCVDITGMTLNTTISSDNRLVTADSLYADHMNLRKLDPALFLIFPSVKLVDLSGNHIKVIPREMNKLAPHLEIYLLADNRIHIPRKGTLLRSNSLDTLMLSNNEIRQITHWTFAKVPKLRVLYLDGNCLTHLTAGTFKHLKNLKYLHLGNNQLKIIPPKKRMPPMLKVYITKGNNAVMKIK